MPSTAAGRSVVVCAVAMAALLGAAGAVRAHPMAPALLDLRELGAGRVAAIWKSPLLVVPGVEVAPVVLPSCRAEGAPTVTSDADSVSRTWTMACDPAGLVGARVGFTGLAESQSAGLVRITLADGRLVRGVVNGDAPLLTVPGRDRRLDVVRTYARLGVEHMLTGVDHLLFVTALLLLARGRRRRLETLVAFTVGYSLTLSLAALDLVRVPAPPIALGIALSTFVLAAELARESGTPAAWPQRWPWAVASILGLLHGLSFADALGEIGLPAADAPLALIAFNGGIEISLLAFAAVLLTAVAALQALRVAWPRWVLRIPLYTMGSLAAFWCFERAAALVR